MDTTRRHGESPEDGSDDTEPLSVGHWQPAHPGSAGPTPAGPEEPGPSASEVMTPPAGRGAEEQGGAHAMAPIGGWSAPAGGWHPPPPPPRPGPWRFPAGGEDPRPGYETSKRPGRHGRLAAALAATALLVAGAGAASLAALTNGFGTRAANLLGSHTSVVNQPSTNTNAVAAAVDPAVVDVTSTLGYQGGSAAGTGMILTSSGEVLTNNHVVAGSTSLSVKLATGSKTYRAHVLGVDPSDDVSLIQLDGASNLPTVKLGDSSKVQVGDQVVAIGNALDLPGPPTVTVGTVSALNRSITAGDQSGSSSEQLNGLIQMDAPIAPGNSGGPLVDKAGEVIGMNTAAATDGQSTSSSSNVGFAIPINAASSIVHQIEAGQSGNGVSVGNGATPFLGVQVADNSNQGGSGFDPFGGLGSLGGANGSGTEGAVIEGVEPGTPAAAAGLSQGDVIVGLGGQPVTSSSSLSGLIQTHHPGDRVSVTWVDQSGQQQTAEVQLAAGPTA